jgi:hypothetical protein
MNRPSGVVSAVGAAGAARCLSIWASSHVLAAAAGDALEHFELFAPGILPPDLAARLHRLREFGTLAGRRVERDDEPNRHSLSSRAPICIDQYHDLPAAASSAPRNGEKLTARRVPGGAGRCLAC